MNLVVEIEPVKKYKIVINGEYIGDFEKESSWEGLIKLKNKDGVVIVNDDESLFSKVFRDIFSDDKSCSFTPIKISPNLIPVDKENE